MKEKLKYNPETLQYEKVTLTKRTKIVSLITILIAALVIYGILFIASSYIAETPAQIRIDRENQVLAKQYKILKERKKQTDQMLSELTEKDKAIYRAIFETEPETDSSLNYNPYDRFATTEITSFEKINKEKLNNLLDKLNLQEKDFKTIKNMINKNKEEVKFIPAIKPVKLANIDYNIYGYGNRIDPVYKSSIFHPGIDFAAPIGTKIYATADGIIFNRGKQTRGKGKQITIKHGTKYVTVYAHLNSIKVHAGQNVKRGDVIGTVGNTGKSFVPHLHYEVIFQGKQINPINFFFLDLTPEKYKELHSASMRAGLSLD